MASEVIEAQGLGKRYRLGQSHRARTLGETVDSWIRRGQRPSKSQQEIWALRDVDFVVRRGEIVGVIGSNGAGKSTLLKTVASITQPTTGLVRTRGRIGTLLEVGTGFHPELTGRENIFLNGSILGMPRRDIKRRFDEIVEFAGLERFLETPVKRYSSGMYLRLAFAVAAHCEPDILVVDEVLAVGDARFREKCLGRLSELRGEGRTALFVSHDLGAIGQLCERALWLDHGQVRADGPTASILEQYLRWVAPRRSLVEPPVDPGSSAQVLSLALTDGQGTLVEAPRRDERFCLTLRFVVRERGVGTDAAIYLLDRNGTMVLSENLSDRGSKHRLEPGLEYEASLTIPPVLPAGNYTVGVWIGTEHQSFVFKEFLEFALLPKTDDRAESLRRTRLVQPPVVWNVTSRPRTEVSPEPQVAGSADDAEARSQRRGSAGRG
jgi:ABC-type polysaccharide/polyol phosphate transport system ATPase subunit